jgi:hypothetical protein
MTSQPYPPLNEGLAMSSLDPLLPQRLRVMQVLAGSLIAGPLMLLGIVLFLVHTEGKGLGEPAEGALPLISLLSLAMLLLNAPLAFYLPGLHVRKALDKLASQAPNTFVVPPGERGPGGPISDAGLLLASRQTSLIISMALFEAAAFFGSVAYLLEARPLALAVSGAAIALLLLLFPTEGRVSAWLDQQLGALADLRMQRRQY